MCSSTNEIHVLDILESVSRSSPKHLVEAVGEVKHSTTVAVVSPVVRGHDHLSDNVVADVFVTEFGLDLIEDSLSEFA